MKVNSPVSRSKEVHTSIKFFAHGLDVVVHPRSPLSVVPHHDVGIGSFVDIRVDIFTFDNRS